MFVKQLVVNVVLPLSTRLGTMAGASLLALGADAAMVDQVILGISAVALIAVDLVFSWIGRQQRDE